MTNSLGPVSSWIAVIIASLALITPVLTFLVQRQKYRLEYLVVSRARLLPNAPPGLTVTYRGAEATDAAISEIRIVNSGYEAIGIENFKTELAVRLHGVHDVVQASALATRPPDLSASIAISGDRVLVSPLLLNPGDMLQLQVLTSGYPTQVTLEGRIVNVTPKPRKSLPYPPGSGVEGELEALDKFMWYIVPFVLAILITLFTAGTSASAWVKVPVIASALVYGVILEPLIVRFLRNRRRLWSPHFRTGRNP